MFQNAPVTCGAAARRTCRAGCAPGHRTAARERHSRTLLLAIPASIVTCDISARNDSTEVRNPHSAVPLLDVFACRVVELGERDRRDPHAPRRGRLQKRLAHDLRRVRHRHPIHVFVQRADQDSLPESVDGAFRLAVAAQPVEKRFAVVERRGGANAIMARAMATLSENSDTPLAGKPAWCAKAQAAPTGQFQMPVLQAREMSSGHTSESDLRRPLLA